MKNNFRLAADHLERLEKEQAEWNSNESNLRQKSAAHAAELEVIIRERDSARLRVRELEQMTKNLSTDVKTAGERLRSATANLEKQIQVAIEARDAAQSRVSALESTAQEVQLKLSNLSKSSTDYEGLLKKKTAEHLALSARLASVEQDLGTAAAQRSEMQRTIAELQQECESAKLIAARSSASQTKAEKSLADMQATLTRKMSEDESRQEASIQLSKQIEDLKQQLGRAVSDRDSATASAQSEANQARAEVCQFPTCSHS